MITSRHAEGQIKMVSQGIIYVATGEKYIAEALSSAETVKAFAPQIPITLFTDVSFEHELFESVVLLDSVAYNTSDKILGLIATPYERTLFLDTDTCACFGFDDLFDLLDSFELAAAYVPANLPNRRTVNIDAYVKHPAPSSFVELNTGILLFRKNEKFDRLCQEWLATYQSLRKQLGQLSDQSIFRHLIYHSNIRFTTLSPEYHFRYLTGTIINGEALAGPVRFVHTRAYKSVGIQRFQEILNTPHSKRIVVGRMLLVINKSGRIQWQGTLIGSHPPAILRWIWSYFTLLLDIGMRGFVKHIFRLFRNKLNKRRNDS